MMRVLAALVLQGRARASVLAHALEEAVQRGDRAHPVTILDLVLDAAALEHIQHAHLPRLEVDRRCCLSGATLARLVDMAGVEGAVLVEQAGERGRRRWVVQEEGASACEVETWSAAGRVGRRREERAERTLGRLDEAGRGACT